MDYLYKSREILSRCLSIPIEQIQSDSSLDQLKPTLDSVTFANIMMEVERFVQKEVPVTEWLELATVADLAAILQKNHTA